MATDCGVSRSAIAQILVTKSLHNVLNILEHCYWVLRNEDIIQYLYATIPALRFREPK